MKHSSSALCARMAIHLIASLVCISIGACGTSLTSLTKSTPQSGSSGVILPTLSLSASSTSSIYGETVTFSITSPDNIVGDITFTDSGRPIGTSTFQNNSASFATNGLTVGTHTISASSQASPGLAAAASTSVVITVSAATPEIEWSTPTAITYGTALSSIQLDATSGSVVGTFTYDPAAGTVLGAGTHVLTVTFIPNNSDDYTTVIASVSITVQKATPIITWPDPSPIYYGSALGASQLDASASVAGTFTYSPTSGTVLGPGTQTLSVVFTPNDSADYISATASIPEVITYPPVAILSQSTSLLEGQASQFTAIEGGSVVQQVQWAVNGITGGTAQSGTISSGGVYTAPSTTGVSVTITATFPAPTTLQASIVISVIGPTSAPGTIGFAFTLPSLARTSAGVYNVSGTLIKTLWSNRTYDAGPATAVWDGTDDNGATMPSGSYQIRLLYNNVQYSWGVIGDTSSSWTDSSQSWDPLSLQPSDMAVVGSTAYVSSGYAEGRPNAAYFNLSAPNKPQALFNLGPGVMLMFMATDGKLLYFVNMGNDWSGSVAYVTAFNPTTNQFYNFPYGTQCGSSCSVGGPSTVLDFVSSAIRLTANPSNIGTGIAVQTTGTLLAVSHGSTVDGANLFTSEDSIELFDKTSGASVGTIKIPNPQRLAFEPDGNLWAISGNIVVMISSVGKSNTIGPPLIGVVDPLAITVDPSTGNLFVVDGGSSQQIKQFSESGQLLTTYGDAGGYTDCNPTISNSRLFLDTTAGEGYGAASGFPSLPFVTVLPDGSYWFSDPGNARTLHVSAQGDYLEQISYLRFLYHVNVDHGNPSRVFANDLEYNVDLTKALVPGDPDPALGGNGSWKLVKNWSACMPTHYASYFYQVQTMPNGITYAGIFDNNISNSIGELAELPATGPVQFSGHTLGDADGSQCAGFINHDGSLGCWSYNDVAGVESQIAYRQDLTGYDSNKWPVWGPSYAIASVPSFDQSDPFGSTGWAQSLWPQATTNGILVTYNTEPGARPGEDHHIGGVEIGGTDWMWKASPGALVAAPDGQGTFPDAYNGNAGINALVEGNNIFEGYAGQYYDFSSQWMHWSEDGLLIGQFGHACNPPSTDGSLWPGCAGNIATMSTASGNGNIYLYNSDENYHPGVHQWTISGLDSIHEITGSTQIGESVTLR